VYRTPSKEKEKQQYKEEGRTYSIGEAHSAYKTAKTRKKHEALAEEK